MTDAIKEMEKRFRTVSHSQIMEWHKAQGGFAGKLSGHAVRTLREMVELCVAAGATASDILIAVEEEIAKAEDRNEFTGTYNAEKAEEEFADVVLLMNVFGGYASINPMKVCTDKFNKIQERKWNVDQDGVLWRKR